MKTLNLIITVILAMAIFSSSAFAIDAKLREADISEEAVKSQIILQSATKYCNTRGVKVIKMYNAKIIMKNSITMNGVIVNSYVVTSDIDVTDVGKCKAIFYVYTGEMNGAKHYSYEGLLAVYGDVDNMKGYRKAMAEYKDLVRNNAAVTETMNKLLAVM